MSSTSGSLPVEHRGNLPYEDVQPPMRYMAEARYMIEAEAAATCEEEKPSCSSSTQLQTPPMSLPPCAMSLDDVRIAREVLLAHSVKLEVLTDAFPSAIHVDTLSSHLCRQMAEGQLRQERIDEFTLRKSIRQINAKRMRSQRTASETIKRMNDEAAKLRATSCKIREALKNASKQRAFLESHFGA